MRSAGCVVGLTITHYYYYTVLAGFLGIHVTSYSLFGGGVQLPVCACKLLALKGRGYVCTVSVLSALGADPARVSSVSGPHRVLTGRTVTLTCNIAAIPDATVVWYKDGSPVPSGPSISTTPDTNTQLTIASATPADSGMYQCVVSNQHSDDVGSISLQVRDPRKGS